MLIISPWLYARHHWALHQDASSEVRKREILSTVYLLKFGNENFPSLLSLWSRFHFLSQPYYALVGKKGLDQQKRLIHSAILLLCVLIPRGPEQTLKGECKWKIHVGNIPPAVFMSHLECPRRLQFKIYQSFGFFSSSKEISTTVHFLQVSARSECFP